MCRLISVDLLDDPRPTDSVDPRVAQQLLRHASSKTAIEFYCHVTAAQARQAAEVVQAALAG
jgi:hypothetical protein